MAGASGRIPSTFIDDLLARVDIVDIIEPRVRLRQRGRDFLARCPFHEERTPSFSVSREKQFYYCFGCRASGTAITFLMEYDGLGFVDAVEELAERVGMEVPRTGPGPAGAGPEGRGRSMDLDAVYAALERANRYYRLQLREHPGRDPAVEYLKSRGLSGEIARRFELGFAPPGWEGLAAALGDTPKDVLEHAGLVTRREGGTHYDRFRDRVMFPIRDRRGRVVGFGGRIIGDGEPKYLNSPDGPVFHKGRELYGQYQVLRGRGSRPARLVVVEGYMDVVALAQFGIDYAVATLGTAATRDHLQQLYRSTREVVFCFDGDTAGRDAAWRALEQALPLMRDGRLAAFLFLPEGEDPDSFVRSRGAEPFEEAMASATPLSELLFSTLQGEADASTLEGRARIVDRAAALVATVPAGAFRTMLVDRTAEIGRVAREDFQVLAGSARRSRDRGGEARRGSGGGRPGSGRRAPSLVPAGDPPAPQSTVPRRRGRPPEGDDRPHRAARTRRGAPARRAPAGGLRESGPYRRLLRGAVPRPRSGAAPGAARRHAAPHRGRGGPEGGVLGGAGPAVRAGAAAAAAMVEGEGALGRARCGGEGGVPSSSRRGRAPPGDGRERAGAGSRRMNFSLIPLPRNHKMARFLGVGLAQCKTS